VPRILVLSTTTGYQLRSFGEAAATAGIDLIFATDRCHHLDDPWRDKAIPVRFHEEEASVEAIVDASRDSPIDGVLPLGDRTVVLAARAAHALGVRGNAPDAARASMSKQLTRERFAAAGLAVPWFVHIPPGSADDARIRFPCVVKPVGLSGSRGVIRADSREQLVAAIERVWALLARKDVRAARTGLEDRIIVEGFIEGREFAIEGVLTEGALRAFAIFDKPEPLDGPYFEETIYVTPSALDPEAQAVILEHVQRAASAVGLTDGPLHAECRIGPAGVFMLEAAARPIGGLCARVLRFHDRARETTVPLEEVLLRHAAGADIAQYQRESRAAAVMMIPIPKRGIFKRCDGIERAARVQGIEEIRITAKKDQLLERLPEAGSYLGFMFARGTNAGDLVLALKEAHALLRFRIDTPLTVVGA
jgi:biotin carboxylase